MAVEILMPKLGLTMKDGTLVRWIKNEGDALHEKEPVLEIETEKLSYNIESPSGGFLLKKLAAEGEKHPVASVLGYVGNQNETLPDIPVPVADNTNTQASQPSPQVKPAIHRGDRVFISPAAKKLAASMSIDYRQIKGKGPNGRIVKADVLGFEQSRAQTAMTHNAGTIMKLTGIRRAISENVLNAWATIPMVTHHVSADAGAMLEYRAMLNLGVTDKDDRVTIGELLLKLTAAALTITPVMNSSLTADGILLHKCVNLGMATALDEGLIVPVIRDANLKSILTLSRKAKDLVRRARAGKLLPDDVQGATFTVSNLGGYGSVDFFTPIIMAPQAAILGAGRIVDTAVPANGEVAIRPMIGLSLTYDHRIIDGATAAEFIKGLMKLMQNPVRALL
jgi:pyruvate dehydrogenase E2 component (dihydrolipoamide acetyltransferase)